MEQAQSKRKVRRSLEEMRQIVSEFEVSGLKRDEFAASIGVSASCLDGWRKKVSAKGKKPKASRLVPVRVDAAESTRPGVEIRVNDRWTVRVPSDFDETTLLRLLGALERGC